MCRLIVSKRFRPSIDCGSGYKVELLNVSYISLIYISSGTWSVRIDGNGHLSSLHMFLEYLSEPCFVDPWLTGAYYGI